MLHSLEFSDGSRQELLQYGVRRYRRDEKTCLAWRGRNFGSFTDLQRRRTVKTYELQSAHVRIMTRQVGCPMMSV